MLNRFRHRRPAAPAKPPAPPVADWTDDPAEHAAAGELHAFCIEAGIQNFNLCGRNGELPPSQQLAILRQVIEMARARRGRARLFHLHQFQRIR